MDTQLFAEIVMVLIGIISLFYGISYVALPFFDVMKMDRGLVRATGALLVGASIAIFAVYAILFR
ncbi:MAG: hypothetical protein TQ35_0004685 [Candidatus Aramenus sulfurataquae]|jgi:nitrogen fixation-related uncharacterized protein|uniref:Uncharacterized protein n=2 Tax=Candidatus Aramenus sulfurataquae TaxID=1326980 RepID=A0AAE3FM84_9CREN|nr:hypothetical protein [Candidatus Aramenus sulfurataquae]